jgi:hypothetical protein
MKWFILPAITFAGLAIVATARADGTEIAQQAPRALLEKSVLAWPLGEPQDTRVNVSVDYVIEPDGRVDQLTVEPGASYSFSRAAQNAVRRFVYSPAPTATTGHAIAEFEPAK